ncbi:MAG: AMP-binding protein [Clostridia bacterium]
MVEKFKTQKNKLYEGRTYTNYKDLVDGSAKLFGDKIAFSYKENPEVKNPKFINVSYNRYKKDIENFGTSLLNLGLEKKRVALISPNRYYWCVTYMATTISDMVVVPLDRALPPNEIESLIIRSQADAVVFDKRYIDTFNDIKKKNTSNLKYYICMDNKEDENEILSFEKLMENGKALIQNGDNSFSNTKFDENEMSIMLFTSGTTDISKAVMLSQKNICSNVSAMTTLIKIYDGDSILSFLPMHHTLECTATYLFCLATGCRICFCDGIKFIAKNMNEYNISSLVCVPALLEVMYKQINKQIKAKGLEFPVKVLMIISNFLRKFGIDIRRKAFKSILDNLGGKIRIIIYGSASTDKQIVKFLENIGITMIQGYGLTETSPVLACENDKYRRAPSTGFPLHNIEVKIDTPNEEGIGEIIAKGPNVMLGYYNNEEATNKIIKDGWFYTGDLGYFDKKGYLYITGRKKDVIILKNGKNIYPDELEKLLNKSDLIDESIVYGNTDKNKDIVLCTKIVYSKENELLKGKTFDEIYNLIKVEVKKVNDLMPVYKYIRELLVTDVPLIKTTTEKVKRHEEIKNLVKNN